MAKIIAVLNNKGGVGKTTIAASLADGLGRLGRRCLVIDLDQQGNASLWLAPQHPESYPLTVGNLLLASADDLPELTERILITKTTAKLTHLILANSTLDECARKLQNNVMAPQNRLRRVIELLKNRYDYILLDCPPRLDGQLPINALVVAHEVIIPIKSGDEYSISGLNSVVGFVKSAREELNQSVGIPYCLLNMHDGRQTLCRQTYEYLVERAESEKDIQMLSVNIPNTTKIPQAVAYRQSVINREGTTQAAIVLRRLSAEVDQRIGGYPVGEEVD